MDTDKLIECVKENPIIWDQRILLYKDKVAREKCWVEVGKALYSNWKTMTDKEKQRQVAKMKSKWRNIRDNYVKFVNQRGRGDPRATKKRYANAQILNFLLHSLKKTGTIPVYHEEDITVEDDPLMVEASCSSTNNTDSPTPTPIKTEQTEQKMTPFQSQLLLKLNQDIQEDSDKSFLLSLLPDMKRLNSNEKIDFKIHVLEFLKDKERRCASSPEFLSNLPEESYADTLDEL